MKLVHAINVLNRYYRDKTEPGYHEWRRIRAYINEVQKPAHNNARDATVLCCNCQYDLEPCSSCNTITHSNFKRRTAAPIA